MSTKTLTTVHFTELKEHAVNTIHRGERYLICHDSRHDPKHFTGGAHLRDRVTASHILVENNHPKRKFNRFDTEPHFYTHYYNEFDRKWVLESHYASDAGILTPDGLPTNPVNYTLHVNDLLRKGIIVDTTPIKRDPDAPPSVWDWDYND